MIRSLAKIYRPFGVQLIIDQATLGHASIDDLGDDDLIELHRASTAPRMHQGRYFV